MSNLENAAAAEKEYILILSNQLISAISAAPEGSLNIAHNKSHTYFYQSFPGQNVKKIRIPDENTELIRALAQKDYDMKVLRNLLLRKMAIKKMEDLYPETGLEDIYNNLSSERKAFVKPVMLTDAQYVSAWLNMPYAEGNFPAKKETAVLADTDNKETAASKSELLIADCLSEAGIPYKYKYPLESQGKIIYPTFTLLNIKTRLQIYLEYSGKLDISENAADFAHRLEIYRDFNIFPGRRLIIVTELSSRPLNKAAVKNTLGYYFSL